MVSFKLETDTELLDLKARKPLESSGVKMVVGNMLQTREEKVTLYFAEKNGMKTDIEIKNLEKFVVSSSFAKKLKRLFGQQTIEEEIVNQIHKNFYGDKSLDRD